MTAAHDLTAFVDSLVARARAVADRRRAQLRFDRRGRRAGRCGLARHRRRRRREPGHDGRRASRSCTCEQSHFFSEQAPGDAIAELGVFGAAPDLADLRRDQDEHERAGPSARCSRTPATSSRVPRRWRTWSTWSPATTTTVVPHRPAFPEIAGGLVAWLLRMPAVPALAGRPPLPGARLPDPGELVPPRRPRGQRDREPGLRGARRGRARPAVGRPPGRVRSRRHGPAYDPTSGPPAATDRRTRRRVPA